MPSRDKDHDEGVQIRHDSGVEAGDENKRESILDGRRRRRRRRLMTTTPTTQDQQHRYSPLSRHALPVALCLPAHAGLHRAWPWLREREEEEDEKSFSREFLKRKRSTVVVESLFVLRRLFLRALFLAFLALALSNGDRGWTEREARSLPL